MSTNNQKSLKELLIQSENENRQRAERFQKILNLSNEQANKRSIEMQKLIDMPNEQLDKRLNEMLKILDFESTSACKLATASMRAFDESFKMNERQRRFGKTS
ncbi:MAG: hypothetical protein FWD02_05145 [Bacteroidales bacterium]|nr:hypothetical protein [Bacteroidales bacterium]